MQRTPVKGTSETDRTEQRAEMEEVNKVDSRRRKLVRELETRVSRVLQILMREGKVHVLEQMEDRIRTPNRCGTCPGCLCHTVGTCHACEGCLSKKGCQERSRQCWTWMRLSRSNRTQAPSSISTKRAQTLEQEVNALKEGVAKP